MHHASEGEELQSMSKKRSSKTPDGPRDGGTQTGQTIDPPPSETADAAAVSPLNHLTEDGPNAAFVHEALDGESVHRPKSKKRKHDKKDSAVIAADGGRKGKREGKGRRDKKSKKGSDKAAKAVKVLDQDREAKRDKSRGKKHKSTATSELRPLRKVRVLLIENGQPRAHFDGELGVLELVLPKEAKGEDSVV